MQALVNIVPLSPEMWLYLAIDIMIAITLMYVLRLVSGKMASVSTSAELSSQDNFAFGISLAGRMLALCIVLSAAAASSAMKDYSSAALSMLSYGVFGIMLIKIGRVLHDKVILNRLDKEKLIKQRNTSVALVDAASSVSTALIIHSVMLWAEGSDANAFFAIFSGFLVTQAILLLTTRIYEIRFRENNQSGSLQQSLTKGQMALAVQHSGNLLGTAFVVTAARDLLVYNPVAYVSNLTSWLIVGTLLTLLLAALVAIAKPLILAGLDRIYEVDQQHNVGVASIELVISVGIALILIGLIA